MNICINVTTWWKKFVDSNTVFRFLGRFLSRLRLLSTNFDFSGDYNEMLQFPSLLLVLIFVFMD